MRMSQAIVIAQQLREGLLTIRGAKDITIIFVLVGMRHLATISGVPNKASLITSKVERIIEKTVVGLIARGNIRPHITHRKSWRWMEDDDTRHRIRAIHQACRTFQYLHGMNGIRIHLYAMFIAPLLTFLSDTIVHHDHSIISQSTNHRFGDTAARGYL